MTTRILPPEEYARLEGIGPAKLLPFTPMDVIVTEDGGRITGALGLLPILHAEGFWIDPEARGKAGVFRALRRELFSRADWVMAGSQDGDTAMESMLTRMGAVRVPMSVWILSRPVKE